MGAAAGKAKSLHGTDPAAVTPPKAGPASPIPRRVDESPYTTQDRLQTKKEYGRAANHKASGNAKTAGPSKGSSDRSDFSGRKAADDNRTSNKLRDHKPKGHASSTTKHNVHDHSRGGSSGGYSASYSRVVLQNQTQTKKKRFEDIPVSPMWRDDPIFPVRDEPKFDRKPDARKKRKDDIMSIEREIQEIEKNYLEGLKALPSEPPRATASLAPDFSGAGAGNDQGRLSALGSISRRLKYEKDSILSCISKTWSDEPSTSKQSSPRRADDRAYGAVPGLIPRHNSDPVASTTASYQSVHGNRRPATPCVTSLQNPRQLNDYIGHRRAMEGKISSSPASSSGRRWLSTIPDLEETSDKKPTLHCSPPPPRRRYRREAEFPSFFTF